MVITEFTMFGTGTHSIEGVGYYESAPDPASAEEVKPNEFWYQGDKRTQKRNMRKRSITR